MSRRYALLVAICWLLGQSTPTNADDAQAWGHIDRAEQFLQQGRPRAATIELKNAAQQAPDNARVRLQLGQLYLDLGDIANATKELQKARALGGDPARLRRPLAEALIRGGQPQAAIELLSAPEPSSPHLFTLRADARLQLGDTVTAAADYAAALAIDPVSAAALMGMARVALRDQGPSEAMPWASRALAAVPESSTVWSLIAEIEVANNHPDAALAAFEQALRLQPDSAPLQLASATLLLSLKRSEEARVRANAAAVLLGPDNPRVQVLTAILDLEQGDAASARDGLQLLVGRYPQYDMALLYLGRAHYRLKAYEQAIEVLRNYLARQPGSPDAARLLALALAHSGAAQEARRVLAPLLQRFPNQRSLLEAQRIVAIQSGDFALSTAIDRQLATLTHASERISDALDQIDRGEHEEALATLDGVLDANPAMPRAELLRFRERARQGDFKAAEADARALALQLPTSPLPPLLLGIALAGQRNLAGAEAAFESAWALAPGNAAVAHRLALLALSRGDAGAASERYRQVLVHHPGHGPTLSRLAQLSAASGDHERQLAYLRQAVAHDPTKLKPRLQLSRALHAQGRSADALALLQQVDGLHGQNTAYLIAVTQLQTPGDPAAAAVSARRLLAVEPDRAHYHLLLANALGRDGDHDGHYRSMHDGLALDGNSGIGSARLIALAGLTQSAEAILQRLATALPDDEEVASALLTITIQQQRMDAALALVRDMRRRHPDRAAWMSHEVRLLFRRGDDTQALAIIGAWQGNHPDDPTADLLLASRALGRQDTSAAIASYRRVLKQNPDNIVALNNLAWLTRETRPTEALTLAQRAARLSPNAQTLDTLGVLLLANHQPTQAVTALRLALGRDPQAAATAFHLAKALHLAGEPAQARQLLERLLLRPQEFTEREQAEALLEQLKS